MTTITDDGSVEFRFYRPRVGEVKLAGDFSNWASDAVAMQSSGEGWWSLRLKLRSGEYRFRYIADGEWYTDYASHGIEAADEGWNSVLLIPADVDADDENEKSAELSDIMSKRYKTQAKSAA
jgi:1,4-alpha-glucan branching enzyme